MYCGTREMLPDGYDDFGNRYDCLKKGYGVGRGILKDKINNIIVDHNINPDALRGRIQAVLEEAGGCGRGGVNRRNSLFNYRNLTILFVFLFLGILSVQIYTLIKLSKIEEEKKSYPPS